MPSGSSSLSQVMFGAGLPAAGQRRVSVLLAGDATIGDNFLPTQRGPSSPTKVKLSSHNGALAI